MSAGNVPLIINDKGNKSTFAQRRRGGPMRKARGHKKDGHNAARDEGWRRRGARRCVYESVSSDTACFPMLFVLIF